MICAICASQMRDILITSDFAYRQCGNAHSLRTGAAAPLLPDRPTVVHHTLPGSTHRTRPENSGRPKTHAQAVCKRPGCAIVFTPSTRHRGQVYCSAPCRLAALDARRAGRTRA